ncbi:metal ion binding protein [Trifolium pratense]|uniref:Metal ion binding protein n=1 Tax=Trifolium pratense TaxID=57577 RepID=A0A2K3L4W1_TRIPR|nr:metal ion binding protein [Trifolium pratense]
MAALYKRAFGLGLGLKPRFTITNFSDIISSTSPIITSTRHVSQAVDSNVKRAFLVDTLQLVRNLESNGLPSKQAEAITFAITEVLNDSLENVAQSFVTKSDMQKSEMIQETNLSNFKSEVQSSQRIECGVMFICFDLFELRVKGVAGPEFKPVVK